MAEESRRRMSRHIRLVLLGSLPTLAGCDSSTTAPAPPPPPEPMEEVEEIDEDPPPDGPGHLAGGPFIAWWGLTHPPIVTHRMVPRAAVLGGGYTRSSSGVYHRTFYGGRSGYMWGGSSMARPSGGSGVVRGGFGGSGHVASGGGS
jgi:hypothetical protein